MKKYLLTLFALTSLTCCSLTPEYSKPQIQPSNEWKNLSVFGPSEKINVDWWEKYGSPQLNILIDDALAGNNDIAASIQRIEQARASAEIAGASLIPSVSAGASIGSANQYVIDNTNTINTNNFSSIRNSSSAQVNISYEVDLLGKNRASQNAAVTQLESTQYTHDALVLITESDVAQAYAQLLAYDERIKIAESNLGNSQKILNIVQARFDNGINSQIEVTQQRSTMLGFESTLVSLKQQRDAVFTQLALLTGITPEHFQLKYSENFSQLIEPSIALLQPSELLSRRPDVAAAEASIRAANFDIGVARASLYPDLNLSLSSTLNSISSPDEFSNALIASTVVPIFNGGSLKANVKLSEARKKELVFQYYTTALTALKEVEDAFALVKSADERVRINSSSAEYAKKTNDLALERYKSGITDFQTLLDAQTSLSQAQDSLLQARLDQITSSITLFRALGGGWNEKLYRQ